MHLIANLLLFLAFCTCPGLAAFAFMRNPCRLWHKALPSNKTAPQDQTPSAATSLANKLERSSLLVAFGLFACCLILLQALLSADFSLQYVLKYIDLNLPMSYRFSALWAGAEGSLLCWATATALFTVCFQCSPAYHRLSGAHKIYFWIFHFLLLFFLLFLLFIFSNPFIALPSELKAGQGLTQGLTQGLGLNPTLRHAAMLFHPPLLLLGYAALSVPACLALSRLALNSNSSQERSALRIFLLLAWALLSAGIVSGAWWANGESTWGNYWSWDPVEIMSLLPWLASTAALHANILERNSKRWANLSSLLAILPLLTCWLGTYVVRSGVLSSRHNFNLNNFSLLWPGFILAVLFLIFLCKRNTKGLPDPSSSIANPASPNPNPGPGPGPANSHRPDPSCFGLLAVIGGTLCISLFLLFATFWPVISNLATGKTFALQTSFFSQSCLPLLTALLLLACVQPLARQLRPHLKNCSASGQNLCLKASYSSLASAFNWALFLGLTLIFWLAVNFYGANALRAAAGLSALLVALAALDFIATCLWQKQIRPPALSAFLAHAGLGLALTGAFLAQTNKFEWSFQLKQGETVLAQNQNYSVTLLSLNLLSEKDLATLQAKVEIKNLKQPDSSFVLNPERRLHLKQGNIVTEKKAFHSSIQAEVSLALLGVNTKDEAMFQMLRQPWLPLLWLGCILMCLCPLTLFLNYRNKNALP